MPHTELNDPMTEHERELATLEDTRRRAILRRVEEDGATLVVRDIGTIGGGAVFVVREGEIFLVVTPELATEALSFMEHSSRRAG